MALFLIALLLIRAGLAFEECDFKCPGGHVKQPTGSPVEVNGCGVQGLNIQVDLFPGFTEACNEHDRCYGKCGASKGKCDNKFYEDLKKYCESWQKQSAEIFQQCTSIASFYYAGVQTMGCSFYLDSQKNACTCVRRRSV